MGETIEDTEKELNLKTIKFTFQLIKSEFRRKEVFLKNGNTNPKKQMEVLKKQEKKHQLKKLKNHKHTAYYNNRHNYLLKAYESNSLNFKFVKFSTYLCKY